MLGEQRTKRNQRDPNPPPMELTERDSQIIEAVYHCRILRQDQIHALFFGSSKTASQRRLALLYHHGFLERKFLTVRASYLLSPALYLLDKRGAAHLRATLGYEDVQWQASDTRVGQDFIEHTLAINNVRVAITLACRILGYPLLKWHSESDLKADFDRVAIREPRSGRKTNVSLIPDAYFAIDTPHGIAHFFLELDRGTMAIPRFQSKVAAYLTYYQSGAYEKRYQAKGLRVLTVTLSQKRRDNLKQAAETIKAGARFWFSVLPDLTPETILNSAVWTVAGKDGDYSLIEV